MIDSRLPGTAVFLLICLSACAATALDSPQNTQNDAAALQHAKELLQSTPLIDGHNDLPRLFAALIQRGWSDGDLRKLAGENTLRVMREVESVARRLQQEETALNVPIP